MSSLSDASLALDVTNGELINSRIGKRTAGPLVLYRPDGTRDQTPHFGYKLHPVCFNRGSLPNLRTLFQLVEHAPLQLGFWAVKKEETGQLLAQLANAASARGPTALRSTLRPGVEALLAPDAPARSVEAARLGLAALQKRSLQTPTAPGLSVPRAICAAPPVAPSSELVLSPATLRTRQLAAAAAIASRSTEQGGLTFITSYATASGKDLKVYFSRRAAARLGGDAELGQFLTELSAGLTPEPILLDTIQVHTSRVAMAAGIAEAIAEMQQHCTLHTLLH